MCRSKDDNGTGRSVAAILKDIVNWPRGYASVFAFYPARACPLAVQWNSLVTCNAGRRRHLACVRDLLNLPPPVPVSDDTPVTAIPTFICRCCGGNMQVAEVIMRRHEIGRKDVSTLMKKRNGPARPPV